LDAAQVNYTTIKKELLAVVFALDKLKSYFLCSHITFYTNHPALRFLLKKPEAKLRLIRWMLLVVTYPSAGGQRKGL